MNYYILTGVVKTMHNNCLSNGKRAGFDVMLLLMVLAELRCILDFLSFVFT